ncbi:hypothetical protein [Solibacillus sp. FSL K6-1126]|uniref:hypothetical protein n=1 Tax=Solibacillus sp. FSL K6-1126 TaxID=2921463 RepID=UPI0030F7207B
MTIKIQDYKLLEDFKAEQHERAEKLAQYSIDLQAARARLTELQTQYEVSFTRSVKEGTDISAELAKIDDDIALQKEVVARRERDLRLAQQAMPDTKISPVEVVARYKPDYADGVRKEFEELVNPKLQLARDLILSAIVDGKEYSSAYQPIHQEIAEYVKGNHKQGLTQHIMLQNHPTDNAKIHKAVGVVSGVRKVLEEVSQFTHGQVPYDYKYIDVAPTVKTKTTEKVGK